MVPVPSGEGVKECKYVAISQKNDIYHFFDRSYWTNGFAIGVLDVDTDLVSFLM